MVARLCHAVAEDRRFQRIVFIAILVGAITVGLETYPELVARHGGLLHAIDRVVVGIFVVEAIVKMAAHGRRFWQYFKDPWNDFDFVIVVLCLIPAVGPYAAVARLARVLRALRLVTAVPRLQIIVSSLMKALPSMVYVGLLLLLLFYVYAVLGVFLFRANDPLHFQDLQTALITMFRVVTLEDWTDVLYIAFHGSDAYVGYEAMNHTGLVAVSQAQPVKAVLFFVSFVLLGTVVILNLVIGVIISSMEEAQHEREQQLLREARAQGTAIATAEEIRLLEHELQSLAKRLVEIRHRIEDEGSTR